MAANMSSEVDVSLTHELHDTLTPLLPLLPQDLSSQLSPSLTQSTIPYPLILSISRWTRQPSSQTALKSHNLDPGSYGMIPLLAGTKSDPDRHFPPYKPADENAEEKERIEARQTRKQVTALLNALLSIIGAGVAAWFIARSAGWRNEWRVLLGLSVSIVVALSEAGLYAIYSSRLQKSRSKKAQRAVKLGASDKKDESAPPDGEDNSTAVVTDKEGTEGLRRRTHAE